MTHPEWKWDGRVAVMSGTTLIAVLGTDGGPAAIAERARLVEVAPRLLAALRGVLLWSSEDYEPARLACEEARAAIAAATVKP